MNISLSGRFNAAAHSSTAFLPAAPVNALELPLLHKNARALPLFNEFLHQSMAAERVLLWVNTPATLVPSSNFASNKSGKLPFLIPQAPPNMLTPATAFGAAYDAGARGDFGRFLPLTIIQL